MVSRNELSFSTLCICVIRISYFNEVTKANITYLPSFFLQLEIVMTVTYSNRDLSLSDMLQYDRGNPGVTQGSYLKLSPSQ